ncbi:MAG: polysaccharide lyase family 7 protein [Hellea sp.]|nr:polysaccharide lyase family 7 protein [Hellea sp.]
MRLKRFTTVVLIVFSFTSFFEVHAQEFSPQTENSFKKKKHRKRKIRLPEIDLSNWSVTVPAERAEGKPVVVEPPKIMDYALNEDLKPYMYTDSIRGSIVFYAEPTKATTPNSKYSRSELREQMVPGDNNINWTFAQGGVLKGKLSVDKVSKDSSGKYHRVIIMQIHGRLTDKQRDLIGQKDNNAPPVLKIYWDKGKIRIKTKKLKNINTSFERMLDKNAWTDDEGFNFEQEVGFRKFYLEVYVSKEKMIVSLNKNEFKTYEGIHMEKWGVFENYFKAGNYLQTRDPGAYAQVSYFTLEASH